MTTQLFPHIVADPDILSGRPVVEGTQVPVSTLIEQVAAGKSLDEVAREYGVSVEDVRTALEYAAWRTADPALPLQPTMPQSPADTGELSPLAAEEAHRLGLDVASMSPLGRDLLEIRARGIAAGDTPLLF